MNQKKYSHLFRKKLDKLKGKELRNVLNKRDEILLCTDLDHYKNLKQHLSKYKRVHVNNSYVILFYGADGIVYFVDYAHHDDVYRHSKKYLRKYNNLQFE